VSVVTVEREQRRGEAAVLRRIWRLHFWVGLFAAPALLTLACTGLIILYSQPLDLVLNRDLRVVTEGPSQVSLDDQVATARAQVGPEMVLDGVTPPSAPGRSTQVDFVPPETVGELNATQVFIDPYTGRYLGQQQSLSGLVGWANRLHAMFGNDGPTVSLPSVGHLIAPSAYPDATVKVGIGGLLIEVTAVWILVLAATGIYLWWPRATERGKPRLAIRWRKGGRVRWRDLHWHPALGGIDRLHRVRTDVVAVLGRELACGRIDGDSRHRGGSTLHPGEGRRLRPPRPQHRLGRQGGSGLCLR
jgi:hypothetical protein